MDLFDYMRASTQEQESPLASRMRPTTLDEVVGQKHIIGKDKLLYRAIKADQLGSIIFTVRREPKDHAGQGHCQHHQCQLSPDQRNRGGKKDMEDVVKEAKDALGMYGKRRFCLWMRFTASTKASRIICFPTWRTAP